MKLYTLSLLGVVTLAGAAFAYAGEGVTEVISDVAAVTVKPKQDITIDAAPIETLGLGKVVYTSEGERLGTIRAMTRRGDEVRTVWVARTEYAPGMIAVIDGVPTLKAEARLAAASHKASAITLR